MSDRWQGGCSRLLCRFGRWCDGLGGFRLGGVEVEGLLLGFWFLAFGHGERTGAWALREWKRKSKKGVGAAFKPENEAGLAETRQARDERLAVEGGLVSVV